MHDVVIDAVAHSHLLAAVPNGWRQTHSAVGHGVSRSRSGVIIDVCLGLGTFVLKARFRAWAPSPRYVNGQPCSHAAISVPRLVHQQEHAATPGRRPSDAARVARRVLGSRFCSGALLTWTSEAFNTSLYDIHLLICPRFALTRPSQWWTEPA